MKGQGLTTRHQRLTKYLAKTCELGTEQYRFGDTHGTAEGDVNELDFITYTKPDAEQAESTQAMIQFDHTESETRINDEYVLHLIITNFGDDIKMLLARLIFWMASERQTPRIDYTLKWNNDSTIDLNIFLEIQERTKVDAKQGLKTC